jgi:hypothetical protein
MNSCEMEWKWSSSIRNRRLLLLFMESGCPSAVLSSCSLCLCCGLFCLCVLLLWFKNHGKFSSGFFSGMLMGKVKDLLGRLDKWIKKDKIMWELQKNLV